MSDPIRTVMKSYPVKAHHIAERLRLRDVRERLGLVPKEYTNYEMIVPLVKEDSYISFYNFGSIVFFNVPEHLIESHMARLAEFRTPSEIMRTSDDFVVEILESGQNKAQFDRVLVKDLTFDVIKLTSTLLAQSTALEYYEILIENLMEKTNKYSRKLEEKGKYLEESEDLVKFIGLCLNTRQEVISNLYIVDSPDEIWENNDLEKLFSELKALLDIDVRYRALEHKIQIIQESVEIIVDLSTSKRMVRLEWIIIILIALDVVLYVFTLLFK